MSVVTEAEPLKAAQQRQKLQQWCQETWPRLYRYVYCRVLNREEAEDVTQETYSRALARFDSPGNLPAQSYLQTVALNLIRDRWRYQKVRGTRVSLAETLLVGENEAETAVDRALIQELMGQLAEEQQTVLQLRIVEGYSRAETARRMGRSEDAVRGLQYRAIQTLRRLMAKQFEEVKQG